MLLCDIKLYLCQNHLTKLKLVSYVMIIFANMQSNLNFCSVFALLSLHLFVYGCNLFMWKSTRINYNFIFEFAPSNALKYRDAFLICTTFMTAVVGAMVVHLILRAGGFSPTQVDTIPGILILVIRKN